MRDEDLVDDGMDGAAGDDGVGYEGISDNEAAETEEIEQPANKGRDCRCCCGCQSLVKTGDGVWFRCAQGSLQMDVITMLTSRSASGMMRKVDNQGREWLHREVVAFDRSEPCAFRFQTSPEVKVGGDTESSEAIDRLMAQMRVEGAQECRQGRPSKKPADESAPTRNQSRYAERQRVIQERCRVEGVAAYLCPQCGRLSPGLTVEGKIRRACSSPKCLGRTMGRESVAHGRGFKRLSDDAVASIRADYSAGAGGYRLLARLHNVSPASVRDLVKGATRRGGKS